jgi:predicted RNA-binding Zn-ribbon protein involved in translation (DUF1610 family)
MPEAWISVQCPECGDVWEDSPTDLPAPDVEFRCPKCDVERSTSEFMKTHRDLEILRDFYS